MNCLIENMYSLQRFELILCQNLILQKNIMLLKYTSLVKLRPSCGHATFANFLAIIFICGWIPSKCKILQFSKNILIGYFRFQMYDNESLICIISMCKFVTSFYFVISS